MTSIQPINSKIGITLFSYIRKNKRSLRSDILSGLTVSLALVPEAVAFALVADVAPLVGLYAAFIIGLIASIFGGRPGMISGATGALAVVIVSLVATHGIEYLFAAVILMGIIQILIGVFRFGKFMRLVPHPVMLGFVNGLAIIIFLAQLDRFKVHDSMGKLQWMQGPTLWIMLGLIALSMCIIHFLPKFVKVIPSSLAAIFVVTLIVKLFNIDTPSISDIATIKGGLPEFRIPAIPFSWAAFKIIFPYALILSLIGLIESLMTLQLIDEVTETRGNGNRECVGQGLANVVTGFFGGMGGCAMIGQSMINVNSGGRGRTSGITAALLLFFYIIVASTLIEMIPIAALVGVMFMVVLCTFEWSSIRILKKIPKSDAFIIILVSAVTVLTDLAIAVACGVVVSALVFCWEKSKRVRYDIKTDTQDIKTYHIHGPLFFGSTKSFQDIFDRKNDPKKIAIDFQDSRVCDHSAIEAISTLIEKYHEYEIEVTLKNLSPDCQNAIEKAGLYATSKGHKTEKIG